jgi:hypothetical protein
VRKLFVFVVLAACGLPPTVEMTAGPKWVSDTGVGSAAGIRRSPIGIATSRRDRRGRDGGSRRVRGSQAHRQIGHRFSGSPRLDRAIAWAVQTMKGRRARRADRR